jgi:chromosomal replication initiator protein
VDKEKVWNKILESIKQEITNHNYRTWFSQTAFGDLTDTQLTINVPSAFIGNQLRVRYLPLIETTLQKIVGKHLSVDFKVNSALLTGKKVITDEENLFDEQQYVPTTPNHSALNPRYTFDNFVVGLTNNVAFAAAQAVAQNPGISYNPLYLYGGTGVGKTHLMLGIGKLCSSNSN